jgi:dihydrofolate synthase/folylpolyglutamate synthase
VFAAMRDKDLAGMFEALLPVVGSVIVTRADTPRSAAPDGLAAEVHRIAPDLKVTVAATPADALAAAWSL